MIPKPIEDITKEDIQALVDAETREGRTLEYKEKLPVKTPSTANFHQTPYGKFLATVCSFANAQGGDVYYGITDAGDDKPGAAVGCDLGKIDAGTKQRELEEKIRAGLAPTLIGFKVDYREGFSKGPVFIVRVPRSLTGPHMVKETSKFHIRRASGKQAMDWMEIRDAFANSAGYIDRIRSFRKQRIAEIRAGVTPVALGKPEGAAIVALHVVPLSAAYGSEAKLDTRDLHDNFTQFRNMSTDSSLSRRYTFQGVLTYSAGNDNDGFRLYTEVYRDGKVESVDASSIEPYEMDGKLTHFYSAQFDVDVVAALRAYLPNLAKRGVPGPYVVLLSLLDIKGYSGYPGRGFKYVSPTPIPHQDLILPEVVVHDPNADPTDYMRESFNMIWQASGYAHSRCYDEHGTWVGNKS